jgi:hypothetical protein
MRDKQGIKKKKKKKKKKYVDFRSYDLGQKWQTDHKIETIYNKKNCTFLWLIF